jgi:hypothetical protein
MKGGKNKMCKICDSLGQWVCDCGLINPIGNACPCGGQRSDTYRSRGVVVICDDGTQMLNRAQRRRAHRG